MVFMDFYENFIRAYFSKKFLWPPLAHYGHIWASYDWLLYPMVSYGILCEHYRILTLYGLYMGMYGKTIWDIFLWSPFIISNIKIHDQILSNCIVRLIIIYFDIICSPFLLNQITMLHYFAIIYQASAHLQQ